MKREWDISNIFFTITTIVGGFLIGSQLGWQVGAGAILIGWGSMPYPQ